MSSGSNSGDQVERRATADYPSIPETILRSPVSSTLNHTGDVDSIAAQELREAQARLFFVFPELQESLRIAQQQQQSVTTTLERQTGVLWKRRDVFKNRWRPRWFSLNPGQGVLTYYLLTTPAAMDVPSNNSSFAEAQTPPRAGSSASRNRATSWDSQVSAVSENTVDYDVVPRGTIYLLGCTVAVNDALSKPNENLYAFTIRPPASSESNVHLAARTAEARDQWVDRIDRVCRVGSPPRMNSSHNGSASSLLSQQLQTLAPTLPRNHRPPRPDQRVIPSHLRTPPPPRQLVQQNREHNTIPEEDFDGLRQEDSTFESFEDDADEDDKIDTWISLGFPHSLYADVPESLAAQIQEKLQTYLPQIEEEDDSGDDWKLLFSHETGHRAYQRTDTNGRSTIKSVAVLNHPPKQVFSLLIDISRRKEFETNVRADERMKVLNPFTFLDYYAYSAVWPTNAREFTVATHWEIVGRGDERAIAVISFSCVEADALRQTAPKHVRANLFVSMYLLRPISRGDEEQCHFTRLLSFDLAGTVNQHLSNVISAQQASLPAVVAEYLQRHEPVIENRYRGLLTNDTVVTTVIKRLKGTVNNVSSPPSPLSIDTSDVSIVSDKMEPNVARLPALESQAIVLFAPVVLYCLMKFCGIPCVALVFSLSVLLAVRQVVLWHLGDALPLSEEPSLVGPVTCRFTVDLKGVLRFIANKKEEREELNRGHADNTDVSVVHIVASALARALKKESALRSRRISIPWLLIDIVVDACAVDVSVSENGGGLVTLKGADSLKIQDIADVLSAAEGRTNKTREVGQCLVLAMSNFDDSEMVIDAAPVHRDVAVVAILGGVHLEYPVKSHRSNGTNGASPRPVLALSLTINGPLQTDIVTCRRFADEVRKLLVYPEICESG